MSATHSLPSIDALVLDQSIGNGWALYHADCVDVVRALPDASIDYSVFSPPFASIYTYSNSTRDMGNCVDHETFYAHFAHLVPELLRVLKPGRLLSFHCMNLPTSKARDGVIGLTDFRGLLIRLFEEAGWIYHSEVCIWKDPVTAMQRTHALGLLHAQVVKDSCMSRQGIPDYLVTMRKPGANAEPVEYCFNRYIGTDPEPKAIYTTDDDTRNRYSIEVWQRYASPTWDDINPSRTLQYASAREDKDEKHICPLQLDVIERAVDMWTNPGDVVLSPFAGIGSEGYVALQRGRKFIGAELKRSYYEQAARNLAGAEPNAVGSQASLF